MKLVPLKSVAEVTMGTAPPGDTYNNSGDGMPMIAGAGDYGDVNPEPKKWTTAPTRVASKGDLIVCVRATIGDLNWADKDYCLGRGVAGLRPCDGKLDSRFLAHFMEVEKQSLARLGTGSTFLAIRRSDLEDFPIPLPPLPEQKRIAAILDKADALRRKRQQAIELTEEFLKSVFLEMFGKDITSHNKRNGIPLGTLADRVVVGHVGPTSHYYASDGIPFLRTGNIRPLRIEESGLRHITREFHDKLKKSQIRCNDVLISRVGVNRGMSAVVPEKFHDANCANIIVISPGNKIDSFFLSYLVNAPFGQRALLGVSVGSAQGVINTTSVKEWNIPEVPVETQIRFGRIVQQTLEGEVMKHVSLVSLDNLFNSLVQRVFRGEL